MTNPRIAANIRINNKLDGLYDSYWIGKFINMFVKKGKKKKITNYFQIIFLQIKLVNSGTLPVLFFLELLEKIRPVFKLENCFPGRVMVVYPKVVSRHKQYIIGLKWIKTLIVSEYSYSRRSNLPFFKQVYNVLMLLHTTKTNALTKKRDAYHKDAVRLQDNIRYSWPKV